MLLNTKGAALKLGCSVTWIRKLTARGLIKAKVYDPNGIIVDHDPEDPHPGNELFFQEQDLEAYKPKVKRRAMGLKDKVANNPNRRGPKKAEVTNDH